MMQTKLGILATVGVVAAGLAVAGAARASTTHTVSSSMMIDGTVSWRFGAGKKASTSLETSGVVLEVRNISAPVMISCKLKSSTDQLKIKEYFHADGKQYGETGLEISIFQKESFEFSVLPNPAGDYAYQFVPVGAGFLTPTKCSVKEIG